MQVYKNNRLRFCAKRVKTDYEIERRMNKWVN